MPQSPIQTVLLSNANSRALNITADTVVKATHGFIVTVTVLVAGSAPGAIHDAATVAAAATANKIAVLPNTVGAYELNFPTTSGIVIKIGTGQTVAVSYS